MAEAVALEMVVGDLDDPLDPERFPAELLAVGQYLSRKGFVHFKQIDIVYRQSGLGQGFARSGHRPREHDGRVRAG